MIVHIAEEKLLLVHHRLRLLNPTIGRMLVFENHRHQARLEGGSS
jgi:hypothetical protein